MIDINVRNVCQALPIGLDMLQKYGSREDSRAGPVLVSSRPVVTVTHQPRARVLFSSVRDANPFFHLVEAIWMLSGRDDAATLNRYVRDFGARYADDEVMHGAYGRRWRSALGFDQLDHVVRMLIENPADRQVVIQMWDARDDYIDDNDGGSGLRHHDVGENDLRGKWKDRPCNTHVYLRVRSEKNFKSSRNSAAEVRLGNLTVDHDQVLDLTVCCRSNDAIWGAHGANAVHFSVLQEYLAARIDVGVGTMYQLSNNYHCYVSELERLRKRAFAAGFNDKTDEIDDALIDDRYSSGEAAPMPMFIDPADIDDDVQKFMEWHDANGVSRYPRYHNPWFECTLGRAVTAHRMYRRGDLTTAVMLAKTIQAPDWRLACTEWLQRRVE